MIMASNHAPPLSRPRTTMAAGVTARFVRFCAFPRYHRTRLSTLSLASVFWITACATNSGITNDEHSCTPAPCGTSGALTVHITDLPADYLPSPQGAFPPPSTSQLFIIKVKMTSTRGLSISPTGYELDGPDGQKYATDPTEGGEDCETANSEVTVAPTKPIGPISLCFNTFGSTTGPFTLKVTPDHDGIVSVPLVG